MVIDDVDYCETDLPHSRFVLIQAIHKDFRLNCVGQPFRADVRVESLTYVAQSLPAGEE
jgi:hypothetical protein